MENESKFSQMFRNLSDKIQDQVWFQQLKVKWDELDSRTRVALKYLFLIGSSVGIVGFVGMNVLSVSGKKKDIDDRLALIAKIQGSQEELRRLKDVTSRFNGGDDQPWAEFLQSKAQPAGFDPAALAIVSAKVVSAAAAPSPKEKTAAKDPKSAATPLPAGITGPEETVVEATLKHVNVRQLTRFVHEIENGGRTVKIRRLQVDTAPDDTGFLDATLMVSAFKIRQ